MEIENIEAEIKNILKTVEEFFRRNQNTPYLITLDKQLKVVEEDEENENYSIFDEEKIVIYPTFFQRLILMYDIPNKDKERIIRTEILKNLPQKTG